MTTFILVVSTIKAKRTRKAKRPLSSDILALTDKWSSKKDLIPVSS
jgi:hypothetical protein